MRITKVGEIARKWGVDTAVSYADFKWGEILRDGRRLLVEMQWGRGVKVDRRRGRKRK